LSPIVREGSYGHHQEQEAKSSHVVVAPLR
jgi:hypothetical protein